MDGKGIHVVHIEHGKDASVYLVLGEFMVFLVNYKTVVLSHLAGGCELGI
jgi:hypothetical protein